MQRNDKTTMKRNIILRTNYPQYLFICETQISKTKCIEICKSNNTAESGGYNTRYSSIFF